MIIGPNGMPIAGSANATVGGMMRNKGARLSCVFGDDKPYDEELEYLESNGDQYIDTGISFNAVNTKITAKYNAITTYTEHDYFGAYRYPESAFAVGCYNRFIFVFTRNNTRIDTNVYSGENEFNVIVDVSNKTVQINDFFANYTNRIDTPKNIIIFGGGIHEDKVYMPSSMKLRRFSIDGICELLPVLDKQGIPCLFDKIRGLFFYNGNKGSQFGYKQYGKNPVAPY